MLTLKRLPLLILLMACLEAAIYLWSFWTSTLPDDSFFAIQSPYIFDKCARLAGRVSSVIFLVTLVHVGAVGLWKIVRIAVQKQWLIISLVLFSFNHLIHLLFVLLRFHTHGEVLSVAGPIEIGGVIHGIVTFVTLILIPLAFWYNQSFNKWWYWAIVLYLLNISSFIVKTFLSKIDYPDHPAYHNQFGIWIISLASVFVVVRALVDTFGKNEQATLK